MKNIEINVKTPDEEITTSRKEYNNLIAQNKELSQKLQWLMETINLNNRKMFGASLEKTEESAQLNIFNEAVYSIIETAKVNGLNSYEYLKFIFKISQEFSLVNILNF